MRPRQQTTRAVLWLALALAGCATHFEIEAATTHVEAFSADLSGAFGPCDGVLHFDGGTTATFALSADGKTCFLHVELGGTVIASADIVDEYRKEVDGYPDESSVAITAMTGAFGDLFLVDDDGVHIAEPVIRSWAATFAIAGAKVADVGGVDSASLFAGVQGLDLGPLVGPLNAAVAANADLPITGSVDVAMDVASIGHALAGKHGVTLDLTLTVDLALHIETTLWSQL